MLIDMFASPTSIAIRLSYLVMAWADGGIIDHHDPSDRKLKPRHDEGKLDAVSGVPADERVCHGW